MNRRTLLRLLTLAPLFGCASGATEEKGRLTARPHDVPETGAAGFVPLKLAPERDGWVYVPRAGRLPLVVLLHGAGGAGQRIAQRFQSFADEYGFMILAPDSRDRTWDVIRNGFGPDVRFIDRALEHVFASYDVDAKHLAIGGFSDGASYALSLGIMNGDLFSHIIAFSPGFAIPDSVHGAPRIFISHGTEDEILPVQNTRRLVERLKTARYAVRYEEFRGPHRAPDEIASMAFAWFIGVRGSGFGVRGSGFGVRGSGFGVRSSGFGVRDSGFGVRSS